MKQHTNFMFKTTVTELYRERIYTSYTKYQEGLSLVILALAGQNMLSAFLHSVSSNIHHHVRDQYVEMFIICNYTKIKRLI